MTQFGSHNWSDYSISVDAMLVKDQPLDGFADVPTVAALMPCQYGAQDQFDLSSSGVIPHPEKKHCLRLQYLPQIIRIASDYKGCLRL